MEGRDGSWEFAVEERESFVVRNLESGIHFLPEESMASLTDAPQFKRICESTLIMVMMAHKTIWIIMQFISAFNFERGRRKENGIQSFD